MSCGRGPALTYALTYPQDDRIAVAALTGELRHHPQQHPQRKTLGAPAQIFWRPPGQLVWQRSQPLLTTAYASHHRRLVLTLWAYRLSAMGRPQNQCHDENYIVKLRGAPSPALSRARPGGGNLLGRGLPVMRSPWPRNAESPLCASTPSSWPQLRSWPTCSSFREE